MKFKYNVIGDNTAENRKWLEMLGYINFDYNIKGAHIVSYWSDRYKKQYFQCVTYHQLIGMRVYESAINCISNSPLFKAVSAMRDDSDYMQWFTDGKYWFENNKCANRYNKKHMPNYRKATLTELQERFKEKER